MIISEGGEMFESGGVSVTSCFCFCFRKISSSISSEFGVLVLFKSNDQTIGPP